MAQLSNYALEAMGYSLIGPSEKLNAKFTRVDVFSIQGISLRAPVLPQMQSKMNGISFRMAMGASLNEVCMQLVDDNFAEDEGKWKRETQFLPPYLLLTFGPTKEFNCSATHCKEESGAITTYDGFRDAKVELQEQYDAVVPPILTALSLCFSGDGSSVRFPHRATAIVGESIDGKKVYDWRLRFDAQASVSIAVSGENAAETMALALEKVKELNRNFVAFFHLGSAEMDPLKKFLNFFLSVERIIHSAFSEIDHRAAVSSLMVGHPKIARSGQKLLDAHRDSWKDLKNKFIWCAMHKWTHLTDDDVDLFERLKSVRDGISHGKLS